MADDTSSLASLSLTHVYYDPSDPISYLCAFLALVPQGLCVVYATLVWSTREVEIGLMFAGQLACEAFNLALKRIIKEERPPHLLGSKGYGMPSSHAQFSFFWAVAVSLFLLARHRPRTVLHSRGTSVGATRDRDSGTRTSGLLGLVTAADVERYAHQPWSLAERLFVSSAALLLAGMVAWSRVYLNYHTPKQVLAGCLAGTLSAIAWFGVTYVMRQAGLISLLLDTPPARWLRLRDLVVEEDLCQAGWEKWEERKSAAQSRKDR